MMQRNTKMQRRWYDVEGKLENGRRSWPFIGGVGDCAVNHGAPTNSGRETSECVPYKETDPAIEWIVFE